MSITSAVRAPKASRRNPFKAGSQLAQQFDAMLKAYADGHNDVVRDGGKGRSMGNSWADNFWLATRTHRRFVFLGAPGPGPAIAPARRSA